MRAADPGRIESIDKYRGLSIMLMVLANFLADVRSVPAWLAHAPDVGLTVIDLIAPFFIFAIGLTYGPSYRRRLSRDGLGRTWGHFLRRSLALIGIGAIISAGEVLVGENAGRLSWGVLQALGAASIVTLALISLAPWARAFAGLVLLGAYQVLLNWSWLPTVMSSGHGGLEGSLAWAAMLVLGTAIADLWHRRAERKSALLWTSLAALGAGAALAYFLPTLAPISKNRVSASYVLVSLGASGLLFACVSLLVDRFRLRAGFLSWWGANPLLLYVMHYLLLAPFVLPGIPRWHAEAPVPLVIAQAAFIVALLGLFAWLLARRGKRISL